MRRLAVLALFAALALTPVLAADGASSADDAEDDGCGRVTLYSGPQGAQWNPGGICGMPTVLIGREATGACTAVTDWLAGMPCPTRIVTPQPVDTRFILPSETVTAGYVGEVAGAPETLVATLDGLGHAGTTLTLAREPDSRAYFSEPFAVEGSGALRITVAMPGGALTTVYRTLDLA